MAFLVRKIPSTVQRPESASSANVANKTWHTRFIADYVFALSTIAFLMSVLGIFVIGNFVAQLLGYRAWRASSPWKRAIALTRYLSYRGFHVEALQWNSAPLGLLLLAAAGTVFFFCKSNWSGYIHASGTSRLTCWASQAWI